MIQLSKPEVEERLRKFNKTTKFTTVRTALFIDGRLAEGLEVFDSSDNYVFTIWRTVERGGVAVLSERERNES